jgi:hypothetical protein
MEGRREENGGNDVKRRKKGRKEGRKEGRKAMEGQ